MAIRAKYISNVIYDSYSFAEYKQLKTREPQTLDWFKEHAAIGDCFDIENYDDITDNSKTYALVFFKDKVAWVELCADDSTTINADIEEPLEECIGAQTGDKVKSSSTDDLKTISLFDK